jgi:hypothetical protein
MEQTQREYFRKKQTDESYHLSEATVQDSIFEKLESLSALRNKNEQFKQTVQHEPKLKAKNEVRHPVSKLCSPNIPKLHGTPVASEPRKGEHMAKENSIGVKVPFNHTASDMLHTHQANNASKFKVSLQTARAVLDDEPLGNQTRRGRPQGKPLVQPLGKPIAHQKPIMSQPTSRETEHPAPSKSLSLKLHSADSDVQTASHAMRHSHKFSHHSDSKVPPTTLSLKQDLWDYYASKDVHKNAENHAKMSTGTEPKVFTHASTQCGFEPQISRLKFDNPNETLDYKLPSTCSQLRTRLGQYLLSQYLFSAVT